MLYQRAAASQSAVLHTLTAELAGCVTCGRVGRWVGVWDWGTGRLQLSWHVHAMLHGRVRACFTALARLSMGAGRCMLPCIIATWLAVFSSAIPSPLAGRA